MYTFSDFDLGLQETNSHLNELVNDYQGHPLKEQTLSQVKESEVESEGKSGGVHPASKRIHR